MNIKRKIREHGLTLAQVAAKLKNQRGGKGITQSALSAALNGNPSIDKLQEIADVIGISLPELLSDGKYSSQINAMIRVGDEVFEAHDAKELKAVIKKIEELL